MSLTENHEHLNKYKVFNGLNQASAPDAVKSLRIQNELFKLIDQKIDYCLKLALCQMALDLFEVRNICLDKRPETVKLWLDKLKSIELIDGLDDLLNTFFFRRKIPVSYYDKQFRVLYMNTVDPDNPNYYRPIKKYRLLVEFYRSK